MYNHAFTRNPFINHSSSPFARFPDISSSTSPPPDGNQFTSWLQPNAGSHMSGSYQDPPMYQQQQQQQQQQQPPSYQQSSYLGGSSSLAPQPTGFQPTSSFGQQLVSNLSGSSYGYLQGQTPQAQQTPQTTTYHPAQQQLQSPTYVAQLDPYAPIGQGWDGSSPLSQQQQAQQPQSPYGTTSIQTPTGSSGTSTSTTPYSSTGEPHPREYVRMHKTEIEAWDSYAWKQLLNAFDALKDAWERRAKEAEQRLQPLQAQMQYAGYYAGQYQQEIGRTQELVKEARLFSDSVAASAFQMREAFHGYRQSGDLASKRRVREATNAALKGLPDWPTQIL